jgi:hypothetical protein
MMNKLHLISHKTARPRVYHTLGSKYTAFEAPEDALKVLKYCPRVAHREECEVVSITVAEFAIQHTSNIGFNLCKFDRYRKSITVMDVADVTIDDSIMFPHVKSLLNETDK